ncbi:HD-GYP domain-containing protein [Salisediminibacterium halotolerans]|uniref:HD-GYP domain-containing protein n=1 Tax=Salisediminibacterium halotolerans TaxID=517425 RepID=UPI000EAF9ED7|nr:HD domain-containing phosphohydrolase [Salisediminibacterium halotolerans]RLJ74371.1 HD domain-containing protein [Actinophytocola xinjiangensis]RPE87536.1 HD domain-containing protein [Salisediminibacterium halotolerans]TWG35208.1 HD domain-containing protein [Salisediminibacterium halotolerans]GEL08160.1 c-di-GMP phosphodiesterase [Salisediminibacterium halotolerans]
MRYVSIDQLDQGEQLGKHIYASDGRILLNQGVTLTIGLISKLRQMGVRSIFIKDDRFPEVEIEEVVSETTRREAISTLANSIQYLQEGQPIEGNSVSSIVEKIIDEVMANSDVLIHLTDIRTKDNELFVHMVNVCIISVMIGVQSGLGKAKVQELAAGAALHDIGKLIDRVSRRDIPTGYTERDELMNHHSWKGFNLLRKSPDISTLSAHIALAHHENIDGTGQPRGLEKNDIHLLARIVAVANDYDHMVSSHTGSKSFFPHEACEIIMGQTNSRFDHQVVWQFLRSIAFYPNGTQVKLSSGLIGVVTSQHKGLPQRPVVRAYDPDGDGVLFEEVDLSKETTTFITRVFE